MDRAATGGASNSSLPENNNATNTYYKNDIFTNVYIDFENQSSWTPYVGGGIGFTSLTAPQIPTTNGDPVNLFGYQAKVGVAYTLNPRSQLFVEGVYQGTPGFTASNSNGSTRFGAFNSFGTKLGLRLRF